MQFNQMNGGGFDPMGSMGYDVRKSFFTSAKFCTEIMIFDQNIVPKIVFPRKNPLRFKFWNNQAQQQMMYEQQQMMMQMQQIQDQQQVHFHFFCHKTVFKVGIC